MENKFNIRPARADEAGLVLEFIKKLAAYEKCADEVVADEATLHHSLFVEHSAEVLFAEENGVVIGFALFFHKYDYGDRQVGDTITVEVSSTSAEASRWRPNAKRND